MSHTLFSKQFTHATLLGLVAALWLVSAVRAADTASEDPTALAAQYTQQAADLRAKADKHAKLAKMHDAGSVSSSKTAHASIAQHCEKIAANLRAAADESDALAATYSELAGQKK
jgi:Mg-chelatase subunit ChlI